MVDAQTRAPDVNSLKAPLVYVEYLLLQKYQFFASWRAIANSPEGSLWRNRILALLACKQFYFRGLAYRLRHRLTLIWQLRSPQGQRRFKLHVGRAQALNSFVSWQ